MYTPCCLALLLLFLVNVSRIGTELCVSATTQDSSILPRSFRQASCSRNVHHFPCSTKFRGLSILLLLCGDISLNPDPISFGVVNCRSVRNKGPSISDMMSTDSFSILAMTETHIRPSVVTMTVSSTQSLLLVLHCVIDPVLTASVMGLAFLSLKISNSKS